MDAVHLKLIAFSFDAFELIHSKVTNFTETTYSDGVRWAFGRLRNIRIVTNGTLIKIEGSVNTYS